MYRPYSSSLADSRPFPDVESQIRNLTQDFVTAFNTGNYDQVAGQFDREGVFMAPHHEPAQGPKAVERLLREFSEAGLEDLRLETTRCGLFRGHGDGDRPVFAGNPAIERNNGARSRKVCPGCGGDWARG